MKRKLKRLIATLILSVTLLGSVMTAQAACSHTSAVREETYRSITEIHTHSDENGTYECYVTTRYRRRIPYCVKCGIDLAAPQELSPIVTHARK